MTEQLETKYYLHKMNEMIVQQICHELFKKIEIRVIRRIQKHSATVLDHYSLKNMWDEICVIVQEGDQMFYDECVDTIDGEINLTLSKMMLDNWQLSAMWLQTQEGLDWVYDHKNKMPEETFLTHNLDDITKYIREEYILVAAMNWSNARIQKIQDGKYEMEDEYY